MKNNFWAIFWWWYVNVSKVGSTTVANTAVFNGLPEALSSTIVQLSGNRSSVIILDNRKLDSFKKYWGKIKLSKDKGCTFFVYKTFLEKQQKPRVKPYPWRTNYRYNKSFGWTFVCFLEGMHSKDSLDAYLYKLLNTGNGRTDHFIFVGGRFVLRPLLANPLMKKFRNAIGIEMNGFTLLIHYRNTCRNTGHQGEPFSATNDLLLPTWIPHKENCLNGHHFRMVGTDFPPFMYSLQPEDSRSRSWEYKGINYLIITNGAERYNYTFSLNHPTEWQLTGERLDNGTWDGVFGDIVYGRAEIASVSTPTATRNGLADFIGPFSRSNLVFMSANPITYADAGEYAIFYPLPFFVWIVLICGFLLLWCLNSIALQIRYSRGEERYEDSIKRAFMMMVAFTFEQEIRKPKGFILRLLMMIWVTFMIIMATSYRYNLASYIVTPQPDEVPRTFHQLYDHKEYRIIFDLGGVSGWQHFKTNEDPRIKALVSRATQTEDTSMCTVTAFMEVSTVCAGWDFSLTFASSRNLTITLGRPALFTSKPLFEAWFVFAIENNSVFTNEFMKIGRTYFEIGLIGMWEKDIVRRAKFRGRKWLSERTDTPLYKQLTAFRTRSSRTILEKLSWRNVQFIFLIFGIGIMVSCITFVGEIFQEKAGVLKRIFNKKKIKIRKISNIVRRKISGELITPNAREVGNVSHPGAHNYSITVTFLP